MIKRFFSVAWQMLVEGKVRSSHHDLSKTLGKVGVVIEKFASRVLEIRGMKRAELRATVTPKCPHCGSGHDGKSHWEPWTCQACGGPRPMDDVGDGDASKKLAGLRHVHYHR